MYRPSSWRKDKKILITLDSILVHFNEDCREAPTCVIIFIFVSTSWLLLAFLIDYAVMGTNCIIKINKFGKNPSVWCWLPKQQERCRWTEPCRERACWSACRNYEYRMIQKQTDKGNRRRIWKQRCKKITDRCDSNWIINKFLTLINR
jgi:hypothetical protein